MTDFVIPVGTLAVFLAWDIETAGEIPGKHALFALGSCVVAVVRNSSTGVVEIVELGPMV